MVAESPTTPLLEVSNVSLLFPGVLAVDDVSFQLKRGEVLAIVGENGAGKSSLMKIIAGVQRPTAGEIRVEGQLRALSNVSSALRQGISLIHQELNLAENLDVGGNIFLGREPRRFGAISKSTIDQQSQRYLKLVGLDVSPRTIVGDLPIGKQQLVEIAKSLSLNANVLIMDEPTSSLTTHETDRLLEVVRGLRDQGVAVIYISHRLNEVEQLADRVVVMRDGAKVAELTGGKITRNTMVSQMVGREIFPTSKSDRAVHLPSSSDQFELVVEALRTPAHPTQALSFSLKAGEIVGIAGLVGAGRTELLTTLFGVTPAVGGRLRMGKLTRPPRTPREAIDAGIMLVPEDRRLAGLVLPMSVKQNLSLACVSRDQRFGLVNSSSERRLVREMVRMLRIKTSDEHQCVQQLSGGNQQKVTLGKWLARKPKVLLLDEPTRGVDVGAKEEIYQVMQSLAQEGIAILFASSELEEIMALSDRTLVMREGNMSGELSREQLSEEAVMHLATGEAS